MNVTPNKRLLENPELPPSKYARTELVQSTHSPFEGLITDVVAEILQLVPLKSVLNFEQAHTSHSQLTRDYWKRCWAIKRYNFIWQENTTPQDQYLQTKVLESYLDSHPRELKNARTRYEKFAGVMQRYPSLGSFIWNDLTRFKFLNMHSFESEMTRLLSTSLSTAGDFLLSGLLHISNLNKFRGKKGLAELKKPVLHTMQTALAKGALCAARMAHILLKNKYFAELVPPLALALCEAKDLEELELLLKKTKIRDGYLHPLARDLYNQGRREIPVLVWSSEGHPPEEVAKLLEEAIEAYSGQVPRHVWNKLGTSYLKLELWTKALDCFEKVQDIEEDVFTFYANLAWVHLRLGNLEKAVSYLERLTQEKHYYGRHPILNKCSTYLTGLTSDISDTHILTDPNYYGLLFACKGVSLEKSGYLNEQSEALPFYKRSLEIFHAAAANGISTPAWIMERKGHIYFQLKDLEKAEFWYTQAIETYLKAGNVPTRVWIAAATMSYELGHLDKATLCYHHAVASNSNEMTYQDWENAAVAHMHLMQFDKADFYSKKALETSKFSFSPDLEVCRGMINKYYGRWDRAKKNFQSALYKYGTVPAWVYDQSARVHAELGDIKAAIEHLEKAIAAYGTNTPQETLETYNLLCRAFRKKGQ